MYPGLEEDWNGVGGQFDAYFFAPSITIRRATLEIPWHFHLFLFLSSVTLIRWMKLEVNGICNRKFKSLD